MPRSFFAILFLRVSFTYSETLRCLTLYFLRRKQERFFSFKKTFYVSTFSHIEGKTVKLVFFMFTLILLPNVERITRSSVFVVWCVEKQEHPRIFFYIIFLRKKMPNQREKRILCYFVRLLFLLLLLMMSFFWIWEKPFHNLF